MKQLGESLEAIRKGLGAIGGKLGSRKGVVWKQLGGAKGEVLEALRGGLEAARKWLRSN